LPFTKQQTPLLHGKKKSDLFLYSYLDEFIANRAQHSVSLHHYNPTLAGNNALSLVNVIKCHDEGVLGKGLGFEGCLAFHSHLLQVRQQEDAAQKQSHQNFCFFRLP